MAIIKGTSGNDVLTGGTGDDWAKPTLCLTAGCRQRERIIGSAGDDTLAIRVVNFVNALSGLNDDRLIGSNAGGKLTGSGGNDSQRWVVW